MLLDSVGINVHKHSPMNCVLSVRLPVRNENHQTFPTHICLQASLHMNKTDQITTKFRHWFMESEDADKQGATTRQQKPRFKPVYTRTSAYARSAIPQMVRLANRLKTANTQTQIILNSGQIITV